MCYSACCCNSAGWISSKCDRILYNIMGKEIHVIKIWNFTNTVTVKLTFLPRFVSAVNIFFVLAVLYQQYMAQTETYVNNFF